MAKVGRPKAFKDAQDLWDEFEAYIREINGNPMIRQRWVGKNAVEVEEKHFRPPHWRGFEAFLFGRGRVYDLDDYRRNVRGSYGEFKGIIRAIGSWMFDRKFSGAATGEYQHNIIAKELGLADIQEVHNFQRPILEDGKELPDDDESPI